MSYLKLGEDLERIARPPKAGTPKSKISELYEKKSSVAELKIILVCANIEYKEITDLKDAGPDIRAVPLLIWPISSKF